MTNPNQSPHQTPAELAAALIEGDARSLRRTAQQAERDGASDEVLAEYLAIRDHLFAAAAWLKEST